MLNCNRPQTKEELFNLHHASLRNAVKCIFGVLKWRFHILLLAPEYNLDIQARIPTALCAIHNFIQEHDLQEGDLAEEKDLFDENGSDQPDPPAMTLEAETVPSAMQDEIAQAMWYQYQQILAECGVFDEFDEESNSGSSDDCDRDSQS
jgi:hypothetical protein